MSSSKGFSFASADFKSDHDSAEKWQKKMDNLPKKVKCRTSDKRSARLFSGQTAMHP